MLIIKTTMLDIPHYHRILMIMINLITILNIENLRTCFLSARMSMELCQLVLIDQIQKVYGSYEGPNIQ